MDEGGGKEMKESEIREGDPINMQSGGVKGENRGAQPLSWVERG